ncbi:MAG: hypothetical protein IK085_09235 [Clostridia bacterium]|nr:hypothetical protein [Clostridia bacterium]
MKWYNKRSKLPDDKEFISIYTELILSCPSTIKSSTKKKNKSKEKPRQKPVSCRAETFRSKGIESGLLTTVLSNMKKSLVRNNTYYCVHSNEDVGEKVAEILKNSSLSDKHFELIVYKKRNEMSNPEAIYYYIRNAFAHGSFEVVNAGDSERVYYFESKKDKTVNAQMRLKESTLIRYIDLIHKSKSDIISMQVSKKK